MKFRLKMYIFFILLFIPNIKTGAADLEDGSKTTLISTEKDNIEKENDKKENEKDQDREKEKKSVKSKPVMSSFIRPEYLIDVAVDAGFGSYLGRFHRHIIDEGAIPYTPVLDLVVSIYIIKYFGVQVLISSGCIIHPRSQPIEGTVLYMGLEFFGQYEWKYGFVKLFTGAGFQHTTMLIQWYSSGFIEVGTAVGIKLTNWIYLTHFIKYRSAFLNSIIIYQKYPSLGLYENDIFMSLTVGLGITARIKNPL